MKIIYFTSSLKPTDGGTRYAYDLAFRLSNSAEILVLCNKKYKQLSGIRQIEVLRSPEYYLSKPILLLVDFFKVRKVIKREMNEDQLIIHFTAEPYAMFLPFLFGLSTKNIITIHGTYSVLPLKQIKTRWLFKKAYQKMDRIISVSNFTKKHLLNYAKDIIPLEKIKVISNGINFIDYNVLNRSNKKTRQIICVGQIKNRKGAHHLLRVAKILKNKTNIGFKINFVGKRNPNSKYFCGLQKYIEENNLGNNIVFTDFVSQKELNNYYRIADLFVLLSVNENYHYEGYPLSFHEAAMWGLPTIGSFNCGAEEAIKDGETGFLVNPADHQAVAEKIIDLWTGKLFIDPQTCKKWAEENDWSKKDLLSIYRD